VEHGKGRGKWLIETGDALLKAGHGAAPRAFYGASRERMHRRAGARECIYFVPTPIMPLSDVPLAGSAVK
jgi:hypothetical protein